MTSTRIKPTGFQMTGFVRAHHQWWDVAAMATLILSYMWIWQRSFEGDRIVCILLYFAIAIGSHVRHGESARDVGFRLDNLPQALRQAFVVIGPLVLITLLIGGALNTYRFPDFGRTLEMLLSGSVWGTLQQYGLLAVFFRRFQDVMPGDKAAMVSAGAIFALFHLPNPFLTAVTAFTGVIACWLYQRIPNIYAIGIAHAVLSLALSRSLPVDVTFGHRVGPGFWKIWDRIHAASAML